MRATCVNMVYELAKKDERVVFIGSDLSPGLLAGMKKDYPDRYYMEGVTEANVIGMAAGMALEGFVPYVNTIATFITRRCYEQVAVDLCLHDLPVRLIGNGGGFVYAPLGPTHEAIEDIAIMRALPNMTVVVPADAEEMRRFMAITLDWPHPIYIRLAKGGDEVVTKPEHGFAIGKAILLREASGGRHARCC
jgi:transketolase